MIVGIDVTHPTPQSMVGTPSIAAVVASTDQSFGQWPGSLMCQKSRQEIVEYLYKMMKERLDLWQRKNGGQLPERILIYRDGVSEGQYTTVLSEELSQVRKACEIYGTNSQPRIAIIVAGKRHHTRFYPVKNEEADLSKMGRGNPKSGTVVDRGVTSERLWDFFMQAHSCIQGTVSDSTENDSAAILTRFAGKTVPLCSHLRRNESGGGRNSGDHAQSLLPIRPCHESCVGLPACLLCRYARRTRQMLPFEVSERTLASWQGFRRK